MTRTRSAGLLLALLLTPLFALAANPIVTDRYTADPTIRFFEGQYWLYTTHDEVSAVSTGNFDMRDWRAYSSTDLEHWTDQGVILSLEDISWASKDAWAIDVVYRDGLYYLYFPVERGKIGVATSTSPAGPFRDAIGGPLITRDMPNAPYLTIDPSVLVDDDGQAYLFFGNDDPIATLNEGGNPLLSRMTPRMVKLKSNMTELDGPILDVPGVNNFFEAPFIHKRNGIYYFSYAGNGILSDISYATATNPMGPYTMRGVINDRLLFPSSLTNHHSIIDRGDKSFFFYHTTELSNGGWYRRSVSADRLYYTPDGAIRKVQRTEMGVGTTLLTNAGAAEPGTMIREDDGDQWYWDRGFSLISKVHSTTAAIAGTDNERLYQQQRYGEWLLFIPATLRYDFAVPNGSYDVELHFAETYFKGNGQRRFHIDLEGVRRLEQLDIHAEAGSNRALVKTFQVQVTDGAMNIALVPVINNPQIAGIAIRRR